MCSPKAPAPPDYAAAATAQGAANVDAARATAKLNNPNVISPYGTQSVTYNGDVPTVTQQFSPDQQALYEKQNNVKGLLGDLGVSGATQLGSVIGKNFDLSGAPAAPGDAASTRQGVIDAMMSRVNEDTTNQRDQLNSNLVAAGIHPGTKAYDDAQNQISRQYNDARQNAIMAGGTAAQQDYSMDSDRRRQAIAEMLSQRQTPLNEVTALMSGSQVSNPFAGGLGYQAGASVQPTPTYQAAKDQYQGALDAYGIQSGASGGMLGGLFSLGSAYLGNPNRGLG